jgi:hypothetical protein
LLAQKIVVVRNDYSDSPQLKDSTVSNNTLKLIKEHVEEVELLIEGSGPAKAYYIQGPFLQAETKNKNGRIYPAHIMEREVARYTKELISKNRALGELGHPESPSINLDRVSHLITELKQSGHDYIGKAKVLDTDYGKNVKAFIDEGVVFGVSSRGLGSLTNTPQGNIVGEDFYLATAADIVADPSAPDAFVRGIMESKEWVWDNGILKEREVAALKEAIVRAPKKKSAQRRLVEAQTFAKFLKGIRVEVSKVK